MIQWTKLSAHITI